MTVDSVGLERERLVWMYEQMLRMREFGERPGFDLAQLASGGG